MYGTKFIKVSWSSRYQHKFGRHVELSYQDKFGRPKAMYLLT